jgi:hypothetical protein
VISESLDMEIFRERWDAEAGRKYLAAGETEGEIAALLLEDTNNNRKT